MTVSTLQAPQKRPCVSPDIPRDGYGFVVTGDSMSSQIEAGDTIYVHPHRPHPSGDTCVFRTDTDGGYYAVRELVRETRNLWYVKQHTPKKSFRLKRSEWPVCHVIVGYFFGGCDGEGESTS